MMLLPISPQKWFVTFLSNQPNFTSKVVCASSIFQGPNNFTPQNPQKSPGGQQAAAVAPCMGSPARDAMALPSPVQVCAEVQDLGFNQPRRSKGNGFEKEKTKRYV